MCFPNVNKITHCAFAVVVAWICLASFAFGCFTPVQLAAVCELAFAFASASASASVSASAIILVIYRRYRRRELLFYFILVFSGTRVCDMIVFICVCWYFCLGLGYSGSPACLGAFCVCVMVVHGFLFCLLTFESELWQLTRVSA